MTSKRMINLNNLDGLPNYFLDRLSTYNNILRSVEFLGFLKNERGLQELISEIDRFCLRSEIIGFHFTRANPENILKVGLLARSGSDIRNEFLRNHVDYFTKTELEAITEAWKRGLGKTDEKSRDHRIFFNFTLNALKNGGAESLLKNYGGEQVYVPLQNIAAIVKKIRNLGTALIIKCSLDPNNLKTFIDRPWGMIAVSTYHRKVNPDAEVIDQDGYQMTSIPAHKIEVINFKGINFH